MMPAPAAKISSSWPDLFRPSTSFFPLRGKTWIFPVAVVVLAGFVSYMGYRLAGHWSPWLLAFALFDTITIALVLHEWRAERSITR